MTGLIILGIIVALVLFIISIYNSLVKLRNTSEQAWSDVDVQLKRRYDLIPNLVETVKGYASHEKETFEKVVQARNMAMSATSPEQKAENENFLSATLKSLFALSENYPDLKANENMSQLSEEITTTENKVAFARQAYNDAVTAYNTYRQTFPPVLFAGALGHGENAELLEFDSAQIAEAPKVSF